MTRHSAALSSGLAVLVLLVLGHGCSPGWAGPWGDCVGNGPITTQNRSVGDFDSITVAGAIDVELTRGQATSVRLEAPKDVLPALETRVEQGRLVLDVRGCVSSTARKPIRAFVTFRQLGAIELHGSGNVTVKGAIQRDRLRLSIHGSGDIRVALAVRHLDLDIQGSGDAYLSGETGSEEMEVSGSGDVDAAKLAASSARVRVSGSGDVDLHVTGELDAAVSGSGDVVYRGNPKKVRQRVHGSGSVEGR